ncbi:MAG: mechanosensitive ion channel [Nanohaloarchaea archaeon]|nr:mechanosensitive ion channel [Candidatus Nanohaloarchaea archaeon]
MLLSGASKTFEEVLNRLFAGITGSMPSVISGILFLLTAYIGIKLISGLVRRSLRKTLPEDQRPIAEFGSVILSTFLWFGAALTLFKILGMGEIAASLGTATGFIALGVAFAVKDMVADAVAGYYLIKDGDFSQGDRVSLKDGEGVIRDVGLRKSRIETENGLLVVGNSEVEQRWTLKN